MTRTLVRALPVAVAWILTGACSSSWQWTQGATEPPADEYPEAHAVVLLDEERIDFHPEALTGRAVVDRTSRMRVRVRRIDKEHRFNSLSVHYSPQFSRVIAIGLRTTTPEGTVRTYGRDDSVDAMAAGMELFTDDRVIGITLPPLPPGSLIEYQYTLRYSEPRLFQFSQGFGGAYPVAVARLAVAVAPGWEVEHLARRLGEAFAWQPEEVERDGQRWRVWERHDLAPLPEDPWSVSEAAAPEVMVRLARWTEGGHAIEGFRDPRALSAWNYRLVQDASRPTDETAALATRLLDGLPADPATRARHLYAWVRDNVKYCAIEIGYGGWRPHDADTVGRLRYGDCKDKANLLKTLLDTAGVPSRLATVWSHRGLPRPFGLPTLAGNFNHMILIVDLPSGPVVTDPTSHTVPFGALPVGDQEADLLPLTAEGSALERTPATSPDDNLEERDFELELRREGTAQGRFTLSASGSFAERLRGALLETAPADRDARLVAPSLGLRRAVVSEVAIDAAAPPEVPTPVRVRGACSLGGFLEGTGDALVLRLAAVAERGLPALPGGRHLGPLVTRSRQRRVERFRFALPADLEASTLPPPVELDRPPGRYRLAWRVEGGALIAERELVLAEHVFPPERYDELKGFFDAVLTAEERPVVLHRRAP
jgi:hypothetical protein